MKRLSMNALAGIIDEPADVRWAVRLPEEPIPFSKVHWFGVSAKSKDTWLRIHANDESLVASVLVELVTSCAYSGCVDTNCKLTAFRTSAGECVAIHDAKVDVVAWRTRFYDVHEQMTLGDVYSALGLRGYEVVPEFTKIERR